MPGRPIYFYAGSRHVRFFLLLMVPLENGNRANLRRCRQRFQGGVFGSLTWIKFKESLRQQFRKKTQGYPTDMKTNQFVMSIFFISSKAMIWSVTKTLNTILDVMLIQLLLLFLQSLRVGKRKNSNRRYNQALLQSLLLLFHLENSSDRIACMFRDILYKHLIIIIIKRLAVQTGLTD